MADDDPISGMSQEEIDEYKEAFGMFDINGDGAFPRCDWIPVLPRGRFTKSERFALGVDSALVFKRSCADELGRYRQE